MFFSPNGGALGFALTTAMTTSINSFVCLQKQSNSMSNVNLLWMTAGANRPDPKDGMCYMILP